MSNIGLMLTALSTVGGVASSISQGYVQKAEADYNASISEGKAKVIDIQKNIEFGQYQRLKGQTMATSKAAVAGAGLEFSGSPIAVIIDAQRQITVDQAIGQFNYERDKGFALADSDKFKKRGKQAVFSGYSNALSTMMKGGTTYYGRKYGFNTTAGADKAGGQ